MDSRHITKTDLRPALIELIEGGLRQAEIAREIGLSRATVNFAVKKVDGEWMPGYEAGRRLVSLLDRRRRAHKAKPQEPSHA